jgi:hypothetical protein
LHEFDVDFLGVPIALREFAWRFGAGARERPSHATIPKRVTRTPRVRISAIVAQNDETVQLSGTATAIEAVDE